MCEDMMQDSAWQLFGTTFLLESNLPHHIRALNVALTFTIYQFFTLLLVSLSLAI